MARPAAPDGFRFRDEVADFLRFVRHPRFTPRLPRRAAVDGWWGDWFPSVPPGRLFQWALLLWVLNLFFLGPIAIAAAGLGDAQHRLNLWNIPWLAALLWAPLIEELVFRYGLRHIAQALWLVPAAVCALLFGARASTVLMLAAILLVCWLPYLKHYSYTRRTLPWRYRLRYRRYFPWVFHLSCLLFAAVHLSNFTFHQTPYWLMPLLVLPQWLTGLVLGWLRMKRGIGASMLLHATFNGGPLLLVWIVLHTVPDLMV